MRGCLDFKTANRYDPRWQLREHWVMAGLEQEAAAELNKLALIWNAGAAQYPDWDDKGELFKFHAGQAAIAFNNAGKQLLPWYSIWQQEEGQRLADLWRKFKEEEKDPEFMKFRNGVKQQMIEETRQLEAEEEHQRETQKRVALAHQAREQKQRRRQQRGR